MLQRLSASLVKFKHNLTGAVQRTLATILGQKVCITDFYQEGDKDYTSAFQRALDSGATYITSPNDKRYSFNISDTLLWRRDNIFLDMKGGAIHMIDATGTKSHILMKHAHPDTQLNAPRLINAALTNEYVSTVPQIMMDNVGLPQVKGCHSWGNNKALGFIQFANVMTGYIHDNIVEDNIGYAFNLYGKGDGGLRTVDVTLYDNRVNGCEYAVYTSDWTEGIFIRRNIFYGQKKACVALQPTDPDRAALSFKMQENDFDSGASEGFVKVRNMKNGQICGNWFSGPSTGPNITLENTGSVLVSDNQAYPKGNFLYNDGAGTVVTNNMVSGGSSLIYFGSKATKTHIGNNHMSYCVNAVVVDRHGDGLSIIGNTFDCSADAIAGDLDAIRGKVDIRNNVGDSKSGYTTSSYISTTPYTTTVGSRPEAISVRKASGVQSISVNKVEVFNKADGNVAQHFIGLGTLPPHTEISIVFDQGNNPWLNRIRV